MCCNNALTFLPFKVIIHNNGSIMCQAILHVVIYKVLRPIDTNRPINGLFSAILRLKLEIRPYICALSGASGEKSARFRVRSSFETNSFRFRQGKGRREYCRIPKFFDADEAERIVSKPICTYRAQHKFYNNQKNLLREVLFVWTFGKLFL